MLRKILITTAAALALGGIAAAPALAGNPSSGGSVSVSAPVMAAETISLTGLSPTITFPTTVAGNTATVTAAESYTVSMTGPGTGYTLTVTPSGTALTSGADTIPNSDLSFTETLSAPGTHAFSGSTAVTINTTTIQSPGDNYKENWALAIPPVPAGTYGESVTYLALANS